MSKKLSPRQVEDLFTFCREHYVYHYDLQLELVDHLASGIEQLWEEDPRLTYTEALWKVFGKFGIYGFAKVRKAKEKALRKKYLRQQWQYIGEFYKSPKIILTIAVIMGLFTLLRLTSSNLFVAIPLLGVFLIYLLIYRLWIFPRKYKLKVVTGMSFMLIEYQKTFYGAVASLANIPVNLFTFFSINGKHINFSGFANNPFFEFGVSVLIVFFAVVLFAVSVYIPERMKQDFIRDFPQFIKA